jgi:asparagine synthase (glutamine-hydrolysing)
MCGIAGIVSLTGRPVAREELHAMCDTLAHRGPDDEGFYLGTNVGLGMRRLSIIDLSTGHQPVGVDGIQRRDLQLSRAAGGAD